MDFLIPYSLDIGLGVLVVLMIVCDAALDVEEKASLWGLGGVGLLLLLGASFLLEPATAGPTWALDPFALFFKRLFLGFGLLVMLAVRTFTVRFRHGEGEYYSLALVALLGGTVLSSAQDWVTLLVGLQLVNVPTMVLVTWARRDGKSLEAGTKTFAFPFHLWAPDAHEGAPTPTAVLLAVASRTAGFVVAMRLLVGVMQPAVAQLVVVGFPGVTLLSVLAALSFTFGTLVSIPQWNVKRLMGYLAIAHTGYLLLGLAVVALFDGQAITTAASRAAATGVCYDLLAAGVGFSAVFLVLCALDRYSSDYEIDSLAGLGRRSPLLGMTLAFGLLSLVGMPPFAGFMGRFLLIRAAFQARLYGLGLLAMVMTVVGLAVALGVLKRIYAMEPVDDEPVEVDGWTALGCALLCVAVVGLGLLAGPFVRLSEMAALSLF